MTDEEFVEYIKYLKKKDLIVNIIFGFILVFGIGSITLYWSYCFS